MQLNVTIKGTSPLLMHAYKGNDNPELRNKSPKEQAEFGTYRSSTGELILPSQNLHRALIAGTAYSKKGLSKKIAGAVWIEPLEISLGSKDFEVHSCGVVVQKARIIRHRAQLKEWQANFAVNYDEALITERELRKIITDTGALIGLLDYRPEKKGPFGRFTAEFGGGNGNGNKK